MLGDYPFAPQVIPGLGGIPLKLEVSVTPSDEVQALRRQVSDLTSQVETLRKECNRASFLYRCETLINLQLSDLCKEHGVRIPPRLFQRLDGFA